MLLKPILYKCKVYPTFNHNSKSSHQQEPKRIFNKRIAQTDRNEMLSTPREMEKKLVGSIFVV